MHRITLAIIGVLGFAFVGCMPKAIKVRDQPHVERLRIQISKARNAIEETRAAIAEARGAPHLAELYVRLAELMSDEARYHYQVANEREQGNKATHVPQVRFLKEQAIGIYELVLTRYPDTPLKARCLFNMGQEHRELGNYEKMREVLGRLVEEHEDSPLRRDSLLILGDDQFDRGKLEGAVVYFRKIIDSGLSRITGLAHYKLAWVYVNQVECKPALTHFEAAIRETQRWVDSPMAGQSELGAQTDTDVRREALVDLIYCYTQERKPETAVAYIRKNAYRRGVYVAALERLASRLSTMDQAAGAAETARELLRLAPDTPDRVDDAAMLYSAIKKTKRYDEVGDDIDLISRAFLRQIRKPNSPKETRDRQLEELEAYMRDLATISQEALNKLPKTAKERPIFARQVARAYRIHVDTFPNNENSLAMLENLVDVLVLSDDDFNAGRRALEVAQRLPEGEQKNNSYYDAVVHFQKTLDGDSDRMQRVVARAGLRTSGQALLGTKLPPERARKVKFSIANTDYDEGRFQAAIDRLNAIALEYPATTEGNNAVHMLMDSYRTTNDYLGLIRAGHRFMAVESPVDAKVKAEIAPIVKAAEQHQLDELSLAAAGIDGGDVTQELEDFAQNYADTPLGERALLNALIAARAAGDAKNLYRIADEIEKKYPKSEQLPGVLSTVARASAARFELDRALGYFRRAANANPAQQVALLVAEGNLRYQLADTKGAQEVFKLALSKADSAAARTQVGQPYGRLLEEQGDPKKVLEVLTPLLDDADPVIMAYVGMAQLRDGDPDNAEATLQQVLDAGAAADLDARARAFYGQAEVFYRVLIAYEPGDTIDEIQELIALIEVTEQSYVKAIREGSPVYTAASLGRLAHLSRTMAERMRKLPIPSDASGAMADAIKKGFEVRAKKLDRQAQDALTTCAEEGWVRHIFHPAVRVCMSGDAPTKDPVAYDQLQGRTPVQADAKQAELRTRLSRNSEDADALRLLGTALLDKGDAHTARLVFAKAAEAGGGPIEANLLGIACMKSGDKTGGLEAFARAANGGLEMGRQNLAKALRSMGLVSAAAEALKRFSAGREGGRSL